MSSHGGIYAHFHLWSTPDAARKFYSALQEMMFLRDDDGLEPPQGSGTFWNIRGVIDAAGAHSNYDDVCYELHSVDPNAVVAYMYDNSDMYCGICYVRKGGADQPSQFVDCETFNVHELFYCGMDPDPEDYSYPSSLQANLVYREIFVGKTLDMFRPFAMSVDSMAAAIDHMHDEDLYDEDIDGIYENTYEPRVITVAEKLVALAMSDTPDDFVFTEDYVDNKLLEPSLSIPDTIEEVNAIMDED